MYKYLILFLLYFFTLTTYGVEIKLSSKTLKFGEPLKVTILSDKKIKNSTLTFGNRSFKLFLNRLKNKKYVYISYLAIPRKHKPGDVYLKISLKFKNRSKFFKHYKITLDYPEKPPEGKVALTKKAKKISDNKKAYKKEGALLSKHFNKKTSRRYFDGAFQMPTYGRISSVFGKLRYYNNGKTSSHAGVDIANKKGTPITAPQHGKVILSETLDIHGNTVMIDHGYGVISIYCHLEQRNVTTGQFLKKGDPLGAMGMTGVASGVHLHWGLSIQNVRVNPLFWTDKKSLN